MNPDLPRMRSWFPRESATGVTMWSVDRNKCSSKRDGAVNSEALDGERNPRWGESAQTTGMHRLPYPAISRIFVLVSQAADRL